MLILLLLLLLLLLLSLSLCLFHFRPPINQRAAILSYNCLPCAWLPSMPFSSPPPMPSLALRPRFFSALQMYACLSLNLLFVFRLSRAFGAHSSHAPFIYSFSFFLPMLLPSSNCFATSHSHLHTRIHTYIHTCLLTYSKYQACLTAVKPVEVDSQNN